MPKIRANDITHELRAAGQRASRCSSSPILRRTTPATPFRCADYAKQFTCISVDPRGAGETDKPAGPYSTELFADDVAAFSARIGIERAHVAGLSLGAATGLWLAAKYPERVKSLSLHSGWTRRATPSSRPWCRAGRRWPRAWAASRRW